jgi:xyloglucan-specific exo-beta-1,4-glucanase
MVAFRPFPFNAGAWRSTIARLAVLLAIPATVGAAPLPYHWRNVVIGGGGFAPGIVFSPVVRGLAYLRTDMGGGYRWSAAKRRWLPLQDGNAVPSYMGVESVAPDPVDADVVYMAVGMASGQPAAVLRSADRGAHWRVTPVPFAMGGNEEGRDLGERLAIDPFHHATLLFGSRAAGLWRSDDAGARWRRVASFPLHGAGPAAPHHARGGLGFVVFDPTHSGRILIGSADPGTPHLFRSDDGGVRWAAIAGGPDAALLPAKAVIGGDGVATITYADAIGPTGVTRGAVWRYDLARRAWADVTPDTRADAPAGGYLGVAVSRQDPAVIAVSTIDRYHPVDTIWRSADGGRHWDALYRHSDRSTASSPFLDLDGKANFGHWIAGLAIDPFDPQHAAYTTGATVYATDGFASAGTIHWRPWTQGIEQTAIIALMSPAAGAPLISGFGDIGGFRHDNLSVSPPHVLLPYLPNTNTLDYAGNDPAVMVRSGSAHSRVVDGPTLFWSADGARHWRPLTLHPVPPPTPLEGPAPVATGDAPIVVGADGRTFLVGSAMPMVSHDQGRSWHQALGLPLHSRPTASKSDPHRFYAVDFDTSRILRSDDGGDHFHAVAGHGLPAVLSIPRPHWRETPDPLVSVPGRPGALWLLSGGALYHSADAGETWQRSPAALAVDQFGIGKPAPGATWPALYAIGTRNGIKAVWRSIDGGAGWRRINDDDHQWGLRFRVITGDPRRFGRVYIGTDGRGIVYGDPA